MREASLLERAQRCRRIAEKISVTDDYAGFIGRDPGGKNIYVTMATPARRARDTFLKRVRQMTSPTPRYGDRRSDRARSAGFVSLTLLVAATPDANANKRAWDYFAHREAPFVGFWKPSAMAAPQIATWRSGYKRNGNWEDASKRTRGRCASRPATNQRQPSYTIPEASLGGVALCSQKKEDVMSTSKKPIRPIRG